MLQKDTKIKINKDCQYNGGQLANLTGKIIRLITDKHNVNGTPASYHVKIDTNQGWFSNKHMGLFINDFEVQNVTRNF